MVLGKFGSVPVLNRTNRASLSTQFLLRKKYEKGKKNSIECPHCPHLSALPLWLLEGRALLGHATAAPMGSRAAAATATAAMGSRAVAAAVAADASMGSRAAATGPPHKDVARQ